MAITWETTFAQLTEPERRLLDVLAWLAPEPIPLFLFEAAPLVEAIADPREALAGLAGYSLVRFDASGNTILVHRLVQEITRGRTPEAQRAAMLQVALEAVNSVAVGHPADVRSWAIWTPLAPHADAVRRSAAAEGLAQPTSSIMNNLAVYRASRSQFAESEPLYLRALAIKEASFGPDRPNVAVGLTNLGGLLEVTNRLAEAEPLYRRGGLMKSWP